MQSLAALNRDTLVAAGIYFPSAGKRDGQMLRGEISAGNAQLLTNAMNDENWSVVEQLLLNWTKEASAKNCQSLLLSNELLVLAMALPRRLEQFEVLLSSIGFQEIKTLLILRNPVEQALSLYKHRAKSGDAPTIEEWSKAYYHYGDGLLRFLQSAEVMTWPLTVRKYRKQALDQLFFYEWLGVSFEYQQPKRVVNPSLSLSELLLIRQLRQRDTWLPRFIYEGFLALPKDEKASELKLTQYYKAILTDHITNFQTTWQLCNDYLPAGEQLKTPDENSIGKEEAEKIMTFSSAQVEVITEFMKEASTPAFQWKMRYRKYKNKLGRLRNSIFQKSGRRTI